jgi:hypothetical protein
MVPEGEGLPEVVRIQGNIPPLPADLAQEQRCLQRGGARVGRQCVAEYLDRNFGGESENGVYDRVHFGLEAQAFSSECVAQGIESGQSSTEP